MRKEVLEHTAKESSWLPNPPRTSKSKVFLETFQSFPTACKVKVQLLVYDTPPSYPITYFPLLTSSLPNAHSRLQMYVFSLYALHMFFPRTQLCIGMPPVWGENKPKVGARGVIIYTHTYTGLNCMGPLTWEIFFSSKYYSTTQSMAGWFHRCRETVGTEGWLLSYTRIATEQSAPLRLCAVQGWTLCHRTFLGILESSSSSLSLLPRKFLLLQNASQKTRNFPW